MARTTGYASSLPLGSPPAPSYWADLSGVAFISGLSLELVAPPSKFGRVTRLWLAKPTVPVTVTVRKQSTSSAGGTKSGTPPALVPYDSANAAATSVLNLYTVVPVTPGTVLGTRTYVIGPSEGIDEEWGYRTSQPIVLHTNAGPVSESLALSFSGAVTFGEGFLEFQEQ